MSLTRQCHTVETIQGNNILVNGRPCIDFSSNDYLGLKKHPKITEAFIQSAKKHGVGSGASALISGYHPHHAEIEYLFAKWLKVDKTILFTSGYSANLGIMSALTTPSEVIFSDKLCHASLIDGIILSRAKHRRYPHLNLETLQFMAKSLQPNLIVTESIFSMEGSLAPIPALSKLAQQFGSGLIIDDSHGIGVLGENGAGVTEHYQLQQHDFSCLVLPLGKAFNALGAIVAGQADIIEAILQFSRTYRYTTAMPPAVCGAIQASLKIIQQEHWRRQQLVKNIQFFIAYCKDKGLNLLSNDETPIKPILIEGQTNLLMLQEFLLTKGFYVSAIRPPTVPKNKARLRISLNSLHTQDEIIQLTDHVIAGLSR